MTDGHVACPRCGESQPNVDDRCARCGTSLASPEQDRQRRAEIEQARRDVERASVSIQRLPGFGVNGAREPNFGTRQYFAEMSNQRRRRLIIVIVLFAVGFAFFVGH